MLGQPHRVEAGAIHDLDALERAGVDVFQRPAPAGPAEELQNPELHSALIPAALTMGHHFSISAFCQAPSAWGVSWSAGGMSWPRAASFSLRGGLGQRLHDGRVQLGDDVGRRALGRPQAVPHRDMQAGQARFIDGRHLGRRRQPLLGRDGKRLDGAGAQLRQHVRGLVEHDVDLAGQKIAHRRRGAAIGHELEARVGQLLEEDAGDVPRGADAAGAGRRLVGVGLQPGDQALHVVGRQVLAAHDQHRASDDQGDRREVGEQVVLQGVGGAVQHVVAPLADAQRVAVGRRARDLADADRAAGARHVVDQHGAAEIGGHALGHHAGDRIGRSAGRGRDDHGDGTRRVRLGRGRICREQCGDARGHEKPSTRRVHCFLRRRSRAGSLTGEDGTRRRRAIASATTAWSGPRSASSVMADRLRLSGAGRGARARGTSSRVQRGDP